VSGAQKKKWRPQKVADKVKKKGGKRPTSTSPRGRECNRGLLSGEKKLVVGNHLGKRKETRSAEQRPNLAGLLGGALLFVRGEGTEKRRRVDEKGLRKETQSSAIRKGFHIPCRGMSKQKEKEEKACRPCGVN